MNQTSRSDETLYSKMTLRLVPFLFVLYIAAYLDRVNVGFAQLQMKSELGFSDAVYGLGAGLFFVGYMLFEVPSNVILHRVGAKRWIARIMVSWAICSAALCWVTTPGAFYFWRFMLGIAEAGFFPGIVLYLTYWFTQKHRARVMALFMSAIPISGIIGGPLSGWILREWGWRTMFIVEAIPSVLLGIWVWFRLENGPAEAKWLSDEEKTRVDTLLQEERQRLVSAGGATELKQGLLQPKLIPLTVIYFGLMLGMYGIGFWLPQIIKGLGITEPLRIGLLSAIPYGAALICMILTGRFADRHEDRRKFVMWGSVIGGLGMIATSWVGDSPVLSLITLTVGTAGLLSAVPIFWSLPTQILGGAAAASGIALINSFGNLGGFVGPYAVGWLKDNEYGTESGLLFLGLVLWFAAAVVGLKAENHAVRVGNLNEAPSK